MGNEWGVFNILPQGTNEDNSLKILRYHLILRHQHTHPHTNTHSYRWDTRPTYEISGGKNTFK